MDYRGLNNITRKDYYPLPLIKETLSGISKIRYFMKLDITAAFHKICHDVERHGTVQESTHLMTRSYGGHSTRTAS